MLINTFVDLLPFRIVAQEDVLNMYSLDQTGVGGRFVSFLTGNNDPAQSAGDFSAAAPGYIYDHSANLRYENQRKVTFAVSGNNKAQVVGITLNGTIEFDENGQKVLFHPEVQAEKEIVPSGMTIPIATRGVFTLKSTAYTNQPLPGYYGVISDGGQGKIAFVSPANYALSSGLSVCRCLSSSGSAFGGYAQIQLTLGA